MDSKSSLGFDYALLGLKTKEARVEVIREAAKRTAKQIQTAFPDNKNEVDSMLTDVAMSTYRLLDPRNRRHFEERIQLCVFSEGDMEMQDSSKKELLNGSNKPDANLVEAELVEPKASGEVSREYKRLLVQSLHSSEERNGATLLNVLAAIAMFCLLGALCFALM